MRFPSVPPPGDMPSSPSGSAPVCGEGSPERGEFAESGAAVAAAGSVGRSNEQVLSSVLR